MTSPITIKLYENGLTYMIMFNSIYVLILFFGTFGFILIFLIDFGDFNKIYEPITYT